ncbi:3'-5' RNA helicase YTHDC2 isoform X2 [Leptinotarsa decemlineata]|uniref:3'-5' RNA helicase YTHDC2 isoform X2 n=1 Tax=Leptinotarsa decemlineata TaxID=7539 RepID=UPI003D309E64
MYVQRYNHHSKTSRSTHRKFDPKCQEATPEMLRIEIDNIFKEFLDNPDANEYIFSANLNNLQRKYIHNKAQKLNIISKSFGKEPDRKLHLKKRGKQLSNQSFLLTPSPNSQKFLRDFVQAPAPSYQEMENNVRTLYRDKIVGKLINSPAEIPRQLMISENIEHIRSNLPIFEKKHTIIETIRNNRVVIISSETGSGKTTQVPQFIMEDMAEMRQPCKIICTQPRRISTITAAERVSFERSDKVGGSVGYHIKLEQKYGLQTNLIYCTTGVFLRNLMSGHDGLKNITHIILDEVHERDKLSDFLLICLKQAVSKYTNLKIILMSATVDVNKFLDYFGEGRVLTIPGRLYIIETMFLENILVLTKYMSQKMKAFLKKEKDKKSVALYSVESEVAGKEENLLVDDALEEYMNFSENYDYRIHYEEATAQLSMYYLSEGVSVDYQHSENGRTALMIAAFLADKEFISRLCNMGANLHLRCNIGKTAFDYASDNPEILGLLNYIKSRRENDSSRTDTNKEAEILLQLYDKNTPDDLIDYELIVTLIGNIHNSKQEGSILVFLPGYDDILICSDRIRGSSLSHDTYKIFFLHSSMNIRDQQDVFKKLHQKRKIILSTNIAETSITIDDVVFVIDTGKAKEKCYDSYNKVSSLQTRWISQACAKQRMGRAGRTQPGMCFRLYSRQRYENMDEEKIPEILRVSLEELCLHTKVLAPEGMNIHNFLMMAPDPPSANSIKVAIENLQFLGALDKEEDLTILGGYLAKLTIEPHLGKMLIYSVIFRCIEPILTLTASMTHKDPFQLPAQANLRSNATERRRELTDGVMSDHLLYLSVFRMWQEDSYKGKVQTFCEKYFISQSTMNSILATRSQLLGQLRSARFIHQSNSLDVYNQNAHCWPLIKAIICTGCYPNLAYPLHQNLATRSEKKVHIQAVSSCSNKTINTWLVYDEIIKHRNALIIRGVSAVTTMTVALVCGIDSVSPLANMLNIDDWIEFEFPDHTAIYLRNAIEYLVATVLRNPPHNFSAHENRVVETLRKVLEEEELLADLKFPDQIGEKPKFFFPQNDFIHSSKHNTWKGPKFNQKISNHSPKKNYGMHRSKQYMENSNKVLHYNQQSDRSLISNSNRNFNAGQKLLSALRNGLSAGCSYEESTLDFPSNSRISFEREQNFNLERDKIFILVRPKEKENVHIAQNTSKWIFSPQTEKKVLNFSRERNSVYLLFTANQTKAFQGMAKFLHMMNEQYGKPTAVIEWIFKTDLPHINVKHLLNPYNWNKPIYDGLDGQLVQRSVAEEFFRIYQGINSRFTNGCRIR